MKKMLMFIFVLSGAVALGGLSCWYDPNSVAMAAMPLLDGDGLPTLLFGGMIVNKANLQAIFINLKTTFTNGK